MDKTQIVILICYLFIAVRFAVLVYRLGFTVYKKLRGGSQ